MRVKGRATIELVEAAYTQASCVEDWLERVVQVARPMLGSELGLVAAVVREKGDRYALEAGCIRDNPHTWMFADFAEACATHDASFFQPYYGPGPLVRMLSEVRRGIGPVEEDISSEFFRKVGADDVLALVGRPTHDVAFALASQQGSRRLPTSAMRHRLSQITLHLENGLRATLVSKEPVAVVLPSGRVVHAEESAQDARVLARLGRHASLIERTRVEATRTDCASGLDLWRALVDGRYSLIEACEAGGPRHYRVYENPPATRRYRALTTREASVVELAARGLSSKWSAYALGLSEPTISETLARTAAKLGARTRTQLVSLAAQLIVSSEPSSEEGVTDAEREVWRLVAEGRSNEEIAALRGRSRRTIANQVSTLLSKTGAGSRRALAALRRVDRDASGVTRAGCAVTPAPAREGEG